MDEKHARGKRVKTARQMTTLSRRAFAETYGIPAPTLQNWEDAKGNGLSEKGARKLVDSLKGAGIYCQFEWLMYGHGSSPQIAPTPPTGGAYTLNEPSINKTQIEEELTLFRRHNPHSAHLQIMDDTMEPYFQRGDLVAGINCFGDNIQSCIGKNCIILTDQGEQLVRRVQAGEEKNRYNLIGLNVNSTAPKTILHNVKLISAATVIWIRRKG